MAFLAPLLAEGAALAGPAIMSGAEQLGASMFGKEALGGIKKLGNVGFSMLAGKSPAHLLHNAVNSGAQVLQDPAKMRNVLEKGGKALDIATQGSKKFTGFLQNNDLLKSSSIGRNLGKLNFGFHHALSKLSKVHSSITPFLGS
jgi:hypothetical protein